MTLFKKKRAAKSVQDKLDTGKGLKPHIGDTSTHVIATDRTNWIAPAAEKD